jgi:hypothetical protein
MTVFNTLYIYCDILGNNGFEESNERGRGLQKLDVEFAKKCKMNTFANKLLANENSWSTRPIDSMFS